MGLLPLWFDLTAKQLVRGLEDTTIFQLPPLHQEDSPTIDLRAVKQISWISSPIYESVSLTGYSLQISVGSANNILASQDVFTLSTDGFTLSGALGLNTAGINALAENSSQTFEVRLMDPTGYYYRLSTAVTIRKSVALAASMGVPATGTPLSVEEANARYVPQGGVRRILFISVPNGTITGELFLNDDGTWNVPTP